MNMTSPFPWQIVTVFAATLGLATADAFLPSHAQPPPIQAITLADRNLLVTLNGAPGQAGWRLRGEKSWRSSGTLSPRLYQGAHWVEFRPVSGWNTPPAVLKESTDPGATPDATPTAIYTAKTPPQPSGSGFLRATPTPPVGGWRVIGGGSSWIPSGELQPDLLPGHAAIEFQPVPGYLTPPIQTLNVFPGQGTATRTTYHPVPTDSTWAFAPLSQDSTSTRHISKAPFCYLGKIDSPLGTFTGVAVAQYTVLTTLQAIYDFENNEFIPELTWSWRHDASFGIQPPLTPAGYVFMPNVLDLDTPQNPENQIVAVYFRTPVANGGHSGHHPYLEATRKALFAGYQVTAGTPIPVSSSEVPLPILSISNGLFTIPNLHLADGLIGAPLLSRRSDGRWYPAAMHLGNGRFRCIDSSIETLIRVAEEAALRGKGGTFRELPRVGSESDPGSTRYGKILITTNPTSAKWMLDSDMTQLDSNEEFKIEIGDYTVNFVEVTNFATPPSSNIIVQEDHTCVVEATYTSLLTTWRDDAFSDAQIIAGINIGPHDDFDRDGISNLLEWAFGFDPTIRDSWQPAASTPPSMPAVTRQTSGDSPRLTIQFLRRKSANGVTYRAEFSSTLDGAWSAPGKENETANPVPGNNEWESVTVVDTVPMAEANSRFARVAVQE